MRITALALAAFFVVVQFYTSLASLSPTPPVGYVFATRAVAAGLIVVLIVSALWCLGELLRERRPVPATSRALLSAWIAPAALAAVLGFDPLSSLQVVAVMLLTGIFHIALVRYYARPPVARYLLGAYLWTGLAASVAALAMLAAREPAALFALNNGRAAGFFVTANQFASFLIAFIFIAFGTALASAGRLRGLAATASASALLALVATVSLAGWFGGAAGAIFFAFASGARRTGIALSCCCVALALVLALHPLRHNPAGSLDRLRTWGAGLRVAALLPLTGTGPMAYWRVYPAIRAPDGDPPGSFGALHPHNAYLSLAAETGAVGLLAFAYGWYRFGRTVASTLRASPPRGRSLALGACAGLVALLAQGLFDSIGIVEVTFVWIPYTALALAAAEAGFPIPARAR